MDENKRLFLESQTDELLSNLTADAIANWGKMSAQQMVEHLEDFFQVSTEQKIFPLITPQEQLPLYKQFLYSDKVFRENTKAPLEIIGEEPQPLRHESLQEALQHLKETIAHFFAYFAATPEKQTVHPVFGPLNFDEWILLHYKHVAHHSRQFSLLP